MAKKVAVPDEKTVEENGGIKKKKRNKCCTCCLIALFVVLVIFVAAFTTGWIIGDKYTKKLFGLSMGDTLGVVNDLYWTGDSDVVTRPYSKKDLNGFYSEIKRNVLLKDEAEIDFDSALNDAINKYLNTETSAQALNASESVGAASGENEKESEITDIFVNMIVGVLNRENIDVERLNKYNADDPDSDEYIFNLNDKQLAAFINTVLKSVLKNANKIDALKDINDMVQLDKVVALKQIRFTAKSKKNEFGTSKIAASSAEITVWIGFQNCAKHAIKKMLTEAGVRWASGIVGWMGDIILPENLYLTLSIPLYGDNNKADIKINDMDAGERARAKKLINGLLRQINGDNAKTLDELLDDVVEKIKPMLEKATDKMDFSLAGKGTIRMDLLDTVAKMASENMDGELTKADFLYVLQALLSDKTEQLNSLTPYRFDNWYRVDGNPVYLPSGGKEEDKISYSDLFIDEIENKYAISFGENKNLTEVLDMLGISLDGSGNQSIGSTDLLDKVNGSKFDALLNADSTADIKLRITDRMLGAVFAGQTDKLLKGNADLEKLSVKLEALTFVKKSAPEKANHMYALLAVDVNISELLSSIGGDGDSVLSKLTTGLMPEDILLTVTVDITRDRSVTRDGAEFVINSCKNTDRALATLEKLAPDIKLGEISDKISATLNDMLDKMDSVLDIELAEATFEYDEQAGWLGDSAAIVMPDIFTVITKMVLVEQQPDGSKRSVVTADELKNVVRDLNNPAEIQSDIDTSKGCTRFIDEVIDKYYFNAQKGSMTKFDQLTAYLSDFSTDKFRVEGKNGLAHDTTDIDDLNPTMTGDELGALLVEQMGDNDQIKSYEIVRVQTGNDRLYVTLSIKLKDLLSDATQVQSLIKADSLYATAEFKLDDANITGDGTAENPYAYGVDLDINVKNKNGEVVNMTEENYNAMMKIVAFFAPEFNIEKQMHEFGKIMYAKMAELQSSLVKPEAGQTDVDVFKFTKNGLEITDFYTFIALKMKPELLTNHSNEEIRETLQGLYKMSENEDEYNKNNFVLNDIMFNPPTPETTPHTANGSLAWTDQEATGLYGNTHIDADFNGFIKRGVESISDKNSITVEQTMILVSGDDRQKVRDVRDWLNLKLGFTDAEGNVLHAGGISADEDYLAIMFSMDMQSFIGDTGSGDVALYPERIYVTVVYKYDDNAPEGEDKFTIVGGSDGDSPLLVFNNMDPAQYDIMVTLMGVSPDSSDESKVNINSVVKQGKDVLNGMTHTQVTIPGTSQTVTMDTEILFHISPDEDGGMGKVEVKNPAFSAG